MNAPPAPSSPPTAGGAMTPAPGAVPAGSSRCAKCGAPLLPTDRFCPTCGAAISSPSAPGGSPPPVDIRERVDQDRGVLKKLQLLVPGFRGYRQGEDLREADSVLRLQIADKVHASLGVLMQRRQALSSAGKFDTLNDLALAISDLTRLEGEIRHAEQGYTGISPALRVSVAGQDQLYEYDYGFALAAEDLGRAVSGLSDPNGSASDATASMAKVRQMVTQLEQVFQARIRTIQKVQVP